MRKQLPTRDTVVTQLRKVGSSDHCRVEVAAWAFSFLDDDDIDVADDEVWEALALLGAADLPSSDHEYLYVDEDFAEFELRLSQTPWAV